MTAVDDNNQDDHDHDHDHDNRTTTDPVHAPVDINHPNELLAWQQPATIAIAGAGADHTAKLLIQLDIVTREKDRDAELLACLRQEIGGVTGRLAATVAEHREQRNQWLREKVEMESRNCQLQALHTQLQARNIKKEKDYEKLQVQIIDALFTAIVSRCSRRCCGCVESFVER